MIDGNTLPPQVRLDPGVILAEIVRQPRRLRNAERSTQGCSQPGDPRRMVEERLSIDAIREQSRVREEQSISIRRPSAAG